MGTKMAFCENYVTYINKMCEQNAELMKASAGGTACIITTVP